MTDRDSPSADQTSAIVIGGGPAGLMAAETLARAGAQVTVIEAKPSLGRKFLMAGKSGLNLTRNEPLASMMPHYAEAACWLEPMIAACDAEGVQLWARGLEQELFTGSTGRVFPVAMKASPLLRAWLGRLDQMGVERRTGWRWRGWAGDALWFDTSDGPRHLRAGVTVLALGGASWARLGSDGQWAEILADKGVALTDFAPSNAALQVDWSSHMTPLFGAPVKGIGLRAGSFSSRGEAVISSRGLEGGGIYAVSRGLREGGDLILDLMPHASLDEVAARLARPRGKASWSNHLRKVLRLGAARTGLLHEFGRPLPDTPSDLAAVIKALPVRRARLRPIDEAISTAGGVARDALDDDLMLRRCPGVFCAGEMLDWEAPTGGYLLTACLATGRWAGQAAADRLQGRLAQRV